MVKSRSLMSGGGVRGLVLLLALSGCRIFEAPEAPCETHAEWVGPCPVEPGDGGDGGNTGSDGGDGDGSDGGADGGGTPGTDGGTNPTTDGGTNPTTDGGTNPTTDAGTNPTTDGGTNPTTDAGTNPLPADAGTNPLPADAGTNPLPDGGTNPTTDGGTFPPADGGTFPTTDGGTFPPADGGTFPTTDGGTFPPADGGTFPTTDGGTFPPADGGTFPPADGGTFPPFDGGTFPPADGGTFPPFDGGTNPPFDGGTFPPFDGGSDDMDAGFDGGSDDVDAGLPDFDDAGVVTRDAGKVVVEPLPVGECRDDLCLQHQYALSPASDGFNGLWIFDPYDVYLAHTEGPEVVQFNNGFAPTTPPIHSRPYQLHGTTPDNLWAIDRPEHGTAIPSARSPLSRFDGYSWTTIPAPNAGPSIRPPALFTGPEATWVAGSHGGALRWDGATWTTEPTSNKARATIQSFWSDTTEPLFGVGSVQGVDLSTQFGAYWQRQQNGTWNGPFLIDTPPVPAPALSAIAGPSTSHLYAVGGQTVLRWTGTTWAPEPLPSALPPGCQLLEAQDVWVKWDGSDVWVTFDSACVLRKKDGLWSAKRLPVPDSFQARQVEGFTDADGKTVSLWLTGYQPAGTTPGAVAYHFTLMWP
jgi:hypothetical protein